MLTQVPAPFVLLDDTRLGGCARLYRDPIEIIEARTVAQVLPALERVRAGRARGLHAAGFLAYEAGEAFEPAAGPLPQPAAPLAWFGLFETYEDVGHLTARLPDPRGAWIGRVVADIDRATYDAQLAEVLALIAAGDLYQANLTFRATVAVQGDPLAIYARLRAASGAGWGAYVDTGEIAVLSLSPELFFVLDDGAITCRPMKGTAKRLPEPRADALAAQNLVVDPKQRAENLMIVDLMRNDLSRIARPGSVAVPELFTVEAYPTIHQMTSTVTATLAEGRDAVDVLRALFPCGSVTGAPKVRAMRAIAQVERGASRGAYCGSIGRIDADGGAAFNVAIRTLTLPRGAAHAHLGLGSGIVADSSADDEWNECVAKSAFVQAGAWRFDLIETMAFDPESGIALLERHLGRMQASAATLGFVFDHHAARNELQAATFKLRHIHRLRLLLSASGAMVVETGPAPPVPDGPVTVAIRPLPVATADIRLRHKTSDRRFYDKARGDWFEVVFETPDGVLTEGSYTSVFVERDGVLLTPPTGPLLSGVLRAELLATGRAVEAPLTRADLAGGFFIGNAVRGLLPAIVTVA
ncbi:MAG TPA: aminodeoxychorismate synthase component I [Sphingomonas sp.]|jgi:para-aminobenzoate synthetase/4-amino-4-deoxychorismate lyase|nr:aminodeoxychorismate synthase component I [Sphingomonas sp.]